MVVLEGGAFSYERDTPVRAYLGVTATTQELYRMNASEYGKYLGNMGAAVEQIWNIQDNQS